MIQKDMATYIVDFCRLNGLRRVFFAQQYSMRSYETGLYDVTTDGNLKLTLNVVERIRDLSNLEISISFPEMDQVNAASKLFLTLNLQLDFVHTRYGLNAKANREVVGPDINLNIIEDELLVTHFEVPRNKFAIFVCPASPRPENPQYSMDELPWFQDQINKATATFVLNENQAGPLDFTNKILEMRNFVKPIDYDPEFVVTEHLYKAERLILQDADFYFPYRITDKDYKFVEALEQWPHSLFAVTDPNDSLEEQSWYEDEKHRIMKLDKSRHQLYLRFIEAVSVSPKVLWTSDLSKTVHMGPVEMYGLFKNCIHKIEFFGVSKETQIREAERCLIKE